MKLEPTPQVDVSGIRRAMTISRKRRIHGAYEGRCGLCRAKVPLNGLGVIYDHEPPIWITLRDEDADVRPLCQTCDKAKTARDKGIIAHVSRIIEKTAGRWRLNRRAIPAHVNPWPKGQKIQSRRGFR